MTRFSSLFIATALAIAPVAAFAQQTATPAQPAVTNAPTTTMDTKTDTSMPAKAASPGVKTNALTKDSKAKHAKVGTMKTPAPAKAAEPSKS